jgi:hypothetical protein
MLALVTAAGLSFSTLPALAQHGSTPAKNPTPDSPAPETSSEDIQRQRLEAERQRADYLAEKARVEHINERVRQYKELMARIPFELAPNTVNMVMVYMNDQNLQKIAREIFDISDNSTTEKFEDSYWPMVLYLNRASDYYDGMPHYGKLDPESPEDNVALFPNVRKQGYKAVVSRISSEDSVISQRMTGPPLVAFRKRLQEQVRTLAAQGGEVPEAKAPARMPGENRVALFQGLQSEPQDTYPSRSNPESSKFVSTEPVVVDRQIALDPSPPAWALRQGINMLGPNYEGYNVQYTPDRFDLAPEMAPIAFMGGRDPQGNARIQPGFHFGLNQRFFGFLVANECAFVAFGAAEAPSMNGGSVNAGLDANLSVFNLSALVGAAGVNVVGGFEFGPAFTGKVRVPVTPRMQILGLYTYTTITKYQVEDATGGHTGVSNASYAGLGIVVR